MTKQVQRRRGTATQHTSFTGAEGELSVNTTNKSVHVHDNVTAGGFEAARVDMDNVTSSSILTAAGITATTAELNYVDGVTSNIQTQLDGKAGTASPTFTGTLTTANLTATGTTTLAGASTSADITFGDNDKAVFGAGSDLQIYHETSTGNSRIVESGTGHLNIEAANLNLKTPTGENYINCNENGNVLLRYDNAQKLATTATGIEVTGEITADGLTVDGNVSLSSGGATRTLTLGPSGAGIEYNVSGTTTFQGRTDAYPVEFDTNSTRRMRLDSNGDISFYEDTGTTAKFFWDASAESLGIGTSSPSAKLEVETADLGGTAGDSEESLRLTTSNTNSDKLVFTNERLSTGTTWLSAAHRIQRVVDVSKMGYIQFGSTASDLITFGESTTERMRIDGDGNVGIGTSSPVYPLVVQAVNPRIQLLGTGTNTGISGLLFGDADTATRGQINYNHSSDSLDVVVNAQEAMRIDGDGNVVVNSTSATSVAYGHKVYVNDTRTGATSAVMGLRFGSTALRRQINFMNPNGIVGHIQTSGSATSYVTSSDYRLKENVVDITDGIERVKQLSPKRFNFIADADLTVDGFIAHETQTVVPEAIDGVKDETHAVGNVIDAAGEIVETGITEPEELQEGHTWTATGNEPVYQGIDQSKIVPVLTAALKEAIAKIEALETRLTALEG